MTAHKHAELMLQYAQDATETDKPWELWIKYTSVKAQRDELLDALKDIAEWTERYTAPGHPIATVARAAIAKATGETP